MHLPELEEGGEREDFLYILTSRVRPEEWVGVTKGRSGKEYSR